MAIAVSVKVLHVLNQTVILLYSKSLILKSYLLFVYYYIFLFKN